jgi:ribosomal protein S18 acetylase RimI-like enzyme
MGDMAVRPYTAGDRPAVRDISFRTGFMGESAASFWRDADSWADIWTSYYTDREPGSLSVATIDGVVVGYLAGCLDTAAMRPTIDELLGSAVVRRALFIRPGTAGFLSRAIIDGMRDRPRASGQFLDARWPAHLHIDLLPVARGKGLAGRLMARWQTRLIADGIPGCHLATLVENRRAHAFFESAGFRDHGDPARVPGMRTLDGGRMHQQIMVWQPPGVSR